MRILVAHTKPHNDARYQVLLGWWSQGRWDGQGRQHARVRWEIHTKSFVRKTWRV